MVISQDVGCERSYVFFFFQAEDGIRDLTVTGVQTCALPIYGRDVPRLACHGPPLRVEELHREPERLGGGRPQVRRQERRRRAARVGHKARYGDLDGEQRIDLDQVLEGRVPSAAQVPGRREQSDRAPIQRVELHATLRQ